MKDFVLMIQFLTRIPLKMEVKTDKNSFARGVLFFPLIGLIIGLFNYALYASTLAILPQGGVFLATVFAVIGNIIITGGLHIDGLADTCDGIFSGRKRERILEIMKDSHIGTFGTIAIIVDLLLRIGLINGLTGKFAAIAIILSPVLSKTAVVQLMTISTYARAEGMGGFFLGKLDRWRITGSLFLEVFILNLTLFLLLGPIKLMDVILINLVVSGCILVLIFVYRSYIYKYIKGMTGDTIGAANEIFEWVFLGLALFASGRLL